MNIATMRAVTAARKIKEREARAQSSREWLAAKNDGNLDSVILDQYIKPESLEATPTPMIGDKYSNR